MTRALNQNFLSSREFVDVQSLSVYFQSDGNLSACVRVASLPEAQLAISKLHRTKVGYKRMLIAYR